MSVAAGAASSAAHTHQDHGCEQLLAVDGEAAAGGGDENVFGNLDDALNAARLHLGLAPIEPPEGVGPTVAREREDAGAPRRDPSRSG